MKKKSIIIGIDASRCRSGGAVAHLIGILDTFKNLNSKIEKIHLWSYQSLLEKIKNHSWLEKHNPKFLEKNLLVQVYWQGFLLSKELKRNKCDVLFTADASSICRFDPMIVFSQRYAFL